MFVCFLACACMYVFRVQHVKRVYGHDVWVKKKIILGFLLSNIKYFSKVCYYVDFGIDGIFLALRLTFSLPLGGATWEGGLRNQEID